MLKIIGRLIGLKGEELKYNKEVLVFMIISGGIFLILGLVHTRQGAQAVYANKFNLYMVSKSQKSGISDDEINKIILEYKETVPINIKEFEVFDIKDRVDNYINGLKAKKNKNLNKIIDKLEYAIEFNNKETIIENLKEINLSKMLKKVSKREMAKEKLQNIVNWQDNKFLSVAYLIMATIISIAFIIVKIVCNINLSNDNKDTSPKNLYR